MVTSAQSPQMTAEEYLEWESLQENRHEYCNGEVSAMESGTKDSDMLAFNLRLALYDHIEERGYQMSGLGCKSTNSERAILPLPRFNCELR